ncbi:hypothetical protein [Empedobacter sp. UBA7248]|uniref:hypothetical protein n=1 Tax=Empedobacter sp. UBA7248 TaxID=1946448 RepID=UPI0025C56144|nr:hypothetical protein [Empedobacter sp. UBA7248]
MVTIHFQEFINQLHISEPNFEIKNADSINIFFEQNGNITKHEILKRFNKILSDNFLFYLRPLNNLTSEWVIDLEEMKDNLKSLKDLNYLKGKITIEPDIIYNKVWNEVDDTHYIDKTILKFKLLKEDINQTKLYSGIKGIMPDDIKASSERFFKDNNKSQITAFLMMKFEDSNIQSNIVEVIKNIFNKHHIKVLRADDKWYSDDLFTNIKTYLHCCNFGIGLFERVRSDYFNPNVSLEIGYMMAMDKPVLLLKDDTLKSLHTDLVSRLYYTFDYQNPEKHLEYAIERWLKDKEII